MMKLSGMIEHFAEVTEYPGRRITEMARSLQKAGFIRKGQGGRYGGAVMNEQDAAALTLAFLAGERKRRVTGAVEAVQAYGGLKAYRATQMPSDQALIEAPIPEVFGLPADHTFLDFLAAAIGHQPKLPRLPSGDVVLGFEASITVPSLRVEATLVISSPRRTVRVSYGSPDDLDAVREGPGLSDQVRITREVDDKFFHDLHIRLFSEDEYQARHHIGSDEGDGDA